MPRELVTLKSSVKRLKSDSPKFEATVHPKAHPFLQHFPNKTPEQIQDLADNILRNGLKEKILLTHDGQTLVDGRSRLAACGVAGVGPLFEYLPEGTNEADI